MAALRRRSMLLGFLAMCRGCSWGRRAAPGRTDVSGGGGWRGSLLQPWQLLYWPLQTMSSSSSSSTAPREKEEQKSSSNKPCEFQPPGSCSASPPSSTGDRKCDEGKEERASEGEEVEHPFGFLRELAPGFLVRGEQVQVLREPSEFYQTLVTSAEEAKKRVVLASLYLGTGHLERGLLQALERSLQRSGGQLQVRVLLDCTRASRGRKVNSRTMLMPLVQQWGPSCQVALFHTPSLRGLVKRCLPQRYNELVGLQHMKVYVFDDDVLISGANLSNDYFTQRQDRYVLVRGCAPLADFYEKLVGLVSHFSLQLEAAVAMAETQHGVLRLHPEWNGPHPFKSEGQEFASAAGGLVQAFLQGALQKKTAERKGDTWIFPLVQMGPLGVRQDSEVTSRLLWLLGQTPLSRVLLATGYFNLPPRTQDLLCPTTSSISSSKFHLLTAHPTANGFHGSAWPSGAVPALYTLVLCHFFHLVQARRQAHRLKLLEYTRPGWTFHAKGLWATLPNHTQGPCLTLVGSPNFGCRSVERDLETQLAIVTCHPGLQAALQEEARDLRSWAQPVSEHTFALPERKVPLWVHLVAYFFPDFF